MQTCIWLCEKTNNEEMLHKQKQQPIFDGEDGE